MDGWVGDIVRDGHRKGRHRADAEEAGQRLPPDHLIVQPAIEWRRGSQGFKIRVSVTALLTSLFSDPGACPPASATASSIRRCRRIIVEGQENPMAQVSTGKL
jgi:hypothetical protein